MKITFGLRRKIIPLFLSLLSLLVIISVQVVHHQGVSAQSSTYNRSEVLNLRRQIRQLESELQRVNQSNMRRNQFRPGTPPPTTFSDPPFIDGQAVGTTSPMFQRLANLLIELKEDLKKMDARLTEVEQKIQSQ